MTAELADLPEYGRLKEAIAPAAVLAPLRGSRHVSRKPGPELEVIEILKAAQGYVPLRIRARVDMILLWRGDGMPLQRAIDQVARTSRLRPGTIRTWWCRLLKAVASKRWPRWLVAAAEGVRGRENPS
ncbi:MAG: hypothetical protein JXP34_14185 [Planctomycetes bacterium]|nr:hypothetical protein [Planctomycetota bacterium]